MANKMTKNILPNIEVLPLGNKNLENTSKGQCHKYKG
jgi:hypothetical protein